MRLSELLRMVFVNIFSSKSKCALTSLGIVAGSATIVLVIAVGQGGKMDVAEQFKNLSAGAIEVSAGQSADSIMEGMMQDFGGGAPGGGMPNFGGGQMLGRRNSKLRRGSQTSVKVTILKRNESNVCKALFYVV